MPKEMIMIKGLPPTLDLGINWGEECEKSILLSTMLEDSIEVLGKMPLTPYNLSKIKSYRQVYLTQEEGEESWKKGKMNWEDIPRPKLLNTEKILIAPKEGGDSEDGMDF